VYVTNDDVALTVGDVLRLKEVYSSELQTYVEVQPERSFEVKLCSVGSYVSSSGMGTRLLDMVLAQPKSRVPVRSSKEDRRLPYHSAIADIKQAIATAKPAHDQVVALYRHALNKRPKLMSSLVPRVARLMNQARKLVLLGKGKKDDELVWMMGSADPKAMYSQEEIRVLSKHNSAIFKKRSTSQKSFDVAVKRSILGLGKPINAIQQELVRTHIRPDEEFSVEQCISNIPVDQRHTSVWNIVSSKEDLYALQDANEKILEKLEARNECAKDLALLRARLLESTEPRVRMPGEKKLFYNAYKFDFLRNVLKPRERPALEAEAEKLRLDLCERNAELVSDIRETFAVHRIGGEDIVYCFVNVDTNNVYERYDFVPGVLAGYDTDGVTRIEVLDNPAQSISVMLPNFRVRFNPKYGYVDKTSDAVFKKRENQHAVVREVNRQRKAIRAKYGGMLKRRRLAEAEADDGKRRRLAEAEGGNGDRSGLGE
jgi:hypothetical protein